MLGGGAIDLEIKQDYFKGESDLGTAQNTEAALTHTHAMATIMI